MNFKLKEIRTNLNILEVYNVFKNDKNTVLLDSSKEDEVLSRYSFVGINPFLIFEAYKRDVYINGEYREGDPFKILEELIESYKFKYDEVDIPFLSGAIGFISYDAGRVIEEIPDTSCEDFHMPDLRFVFYDNLIIFDLINNRQYISALGMLNESTVSISEIELQIEKGIKLEVKEVLNTSNNFKSNFTKEEYKDSIKTLKDYIVSGDVYIANMTQRFQCYNDEEPIEIYKKLRTINKAPFSAFLNYEDFQIISSSPERFIQIVNGIAHTRPIKGTRPRGATKEQDEKNRLELINSEKDKAELLMVVDLERNDFSKVCKSGTVKVTELFKLEEYATVFHLVSTIEGQLDDGISAIKCIRECFPGGSITGTPKIRAMEIIEELEGLKRNIYTGSIGYFDFRGNSDFNIVIRTIIKKGNKAYFGVGGGITYDSIEEDEYNETIDKAKALMRVL